MYKKKANVETRSPAIAELEEHRRLVRAIMKGSAALRNATYLPKYPAEEQADYDARCARTFLDNFVGMAIDKSTGKIFAKEIKLDNVPPDILTITENIDRQGRALSPFMMDVAAIAFQDGISYVMADMPRTEGVVTKADEKKLGVRPYAIHIKPENIIEILSEMINGVETVTRLRVKEELSVPVAGEWGYQEIEQVRVWIREPTGLVRWELWREVEDESREEKWVKVEEANTTFKSIYLVPFYTNRTGFMLGAPPFQNIAESTLEHFQLKSDYQAALEMVCFGMYYATGVPDEFQMKVGPRQSLVSSAPDAKFGVMETTGAAVTLALEAIKAVESRIESTGVDLRVENGGNITATAAALDSEDTDSTLKAIAKGFSDSCEQLFVYFEEMMNSDIKNAGDVEFSTDFGTRHGSDAGLQSLDKAVALGTISQEGYMNVLKWRGELPPEFDILADIEMANSEAPDINIGATGA